METVQIQAIQFSNLTTEFNDFIKAFVDGTSLPCRAVINGTETDVDIKLHSIPTNAKRSLFFDCTITIDDEVTVFGCLSLKLDSTINPDRVFVVRSTTLYPIPVHEFAKIVCK